MRSLITAAFILFSASCAVGQTIQETTDFIKKKLEACPIASEYLLQNGTLRVSLSGNRKISFSGGKLTMTRATVSIITPTLLPWSERGPIAKKSARDEMVFPLSGLSAPVICSGWPVKKRDVSHRTAPFSYKCFKRITMRGW